MKRKYNINQIDERMLKYANAYIKQVVNNAQKNYFRNYGSDCEPFEKVKLYCF